MSKPLRATEMDYWRGAEGRSRILRVTNEIIREIMEFKSHWRHSNESTHLVWKRAKNGHKTNYYQIPI